MVFCRQTRCSITEHDPFSVPVTIQQFPSRWKRFHEIKANNKAGNAAPYGSQSCSLCQIVISWKTTQLEPCREVSIKERFDKCVMPATIMVVVILIACYFPWTRCSGCVCSFHKEVLVYSHMNGVSRLSCNSSDDPCPFLVVTVGWLYMTL